MLQNFNIDSHILHSISNTWRVCREELGVSSCFTPWKEQRQGYEAEKIENCSAGIRLRNSTLQEHGGDKDWAAALGEDTHGNYNVKTGAGMAQRWKGEKNVLPEMNDSKENR